MKKIMLLLIALVGMVVFTPNANAKPNAIIENKKNQSGDQFINSGIYYSASGKPQENDPQFHIFDQYIEMNGKLFKAWCLDPGLRARSKDEYTCTPLNDAGLEFLFNNSNGDLVTMTTAFRFYAIYEGIGMNIMDANGHIVPHNSTTASRDALVNYLNARDSGKPGDNFLYGDIDKVKTAYNLASIAAGVKKAAGVINPSSKDGSSIKFTRTSSNTSTSPSVTYTVTSDFIMKQSEMEFTCDNCKSIDVDWGPDDNSVTLKVNRNPENADCNFTIYANFKKNGIYGCYGGAGNQFVVALINDPQAAKVPYEDVYPGCGEDPCCGEEPLDNDKQGSVVNCCEETTHSYVKEYDLDELFCYNNGLKVDKYWEKCESDGYINLDVSLNEYCDMYCTERVTIDVPGAITAKSGRYFTLTPNKNIEAHTTSPYIEGYKRCRIRVKYDLWEKDYIEAVKEEVDAYNNYQKAAVKYYFYVDTSSGGGFKGSTEKEDSVTFEQKCVYKYDCQVESDEPCIIGTKDCSSKGKKLIGTKCTGESESATDTFSYKYTQYSFEKSLNYQTAKFNSSLHGGITISKDALVNESHVPYTVYNVGKAIDDLKKSAEGLTCPTDVHPNATKSGSPIILGKDNKEINADKKTNPDGSERNLQDRISDVVNGVNENFDAMKNELKENMDIAAKPYSAAVATVKNLEDKLTKCDNFFTTSEADAKVMYKFNPTMAFKYSQIYRNDKGESVLDEITIPFQNTPGCQITGPDIAELGTGGIKYEGGMDISEPRYSEIYGGGFFIGTTFSDTIPSYGKFNTKTYNANKLFTHDARYKAVCEWEEEENNVNTLVPSGAVSETATFNFTKHHREYKVYLTTYDGSFETNWSLSNIGENGKFDNWIINHSEDTCSGDNVTKDNMFTCSLHVEHEIVYTGKCNGPTKNPEDCDPVDNVDGLFQFKIADPANIFPTGTTTDTGVAIAKNWTDTEEGRQTKLEIEERGKKTMTYSPERETYKFHFTPEIMRHIKNYNVSRNSNFGGYSDFNMTCECPKDVQTNTANGGGKGCIKCKSVLLTDLANGSISYENQSYKVNAWSANKSIDQVRNDSHWR